MPLECDLFKIRIKWNHRDAPTSPYLAYVVNPEKVRVIGGWHTIFDRPPQILLHQPSSRVTESIRASTQTLTTRSQASLVDNQSSEAIVEEIFRQVDLDHNNRLSVEEVEKVLLPLN